MLKTHIELSTRLRERCLGRKQDAPKSMVCGFVKNYNDLVGLLLGSFAAYEYVVTVAGREGAYVLVCVFVEAQG